jgi:hypothetical protein
METQCTLMDGRGHKGNVQTTCVLDAASYGVCMCTLGRHIYSTIIVTLINITLFKTYVDCRADQLSSVALSLS